MKTLRILFLSLLLIGFCSCENDDSESPTTDDDPQTTSFSEVKTDNWRDNIGQEFTVEGIFINTNGVTKLLTNADDFYVDALTEEDNYIHLDVSQVSNQINHDDYFGKRVRITGTCVENSDSTILQSAELIGDVSLATILVTNISNIVILNSSVVITPIPVFSICDRYPMLCNFQIDPFAHKKALLYSGGINSSYAYTRYWNDIKLMYQILLNKGYQEENIRVVYKNGTGEDSDIPVHYAATPTGLDNAFSYLNEFMNGQDQFFLMMNNHGGGKDNDGRYSTAVFDSDGDDNRGSINDNSDEQYYFYNNSTALTDDWLAERINNLNMSSMIAVVKPCYSGGVIWDFRGDNRVVLTSGTEFQVTWSHHSGQYGEQTFHFFSAIMGENPITGAPVNADLDGNGQISMYEAQMYILDNDARSENPQYDDNGDGIENTPTTGGIGNNMYL
ncbi:hypothetical protein IA57_08470 [Mangrovimonas yunxiaonensis]|uniref:EF-hand domain-containing protein n=1 Tax=Mangrovimonas yunxiaonensis TaxID=1197477 RepID=A0A084TIG9_9FLAO|nr:hypothetical protein [Mangrovimonas yunxiaonensis]KFB00505.1 hypothetical protein IA57_08470 [Mangrovimonas yunxiaonensis]GGH34317.1 hypothetical protein GCM10011364_00090 [Mangrovimonas yunxiaonensis]